MIVRTFTGASMAETLDKVRQTFGSDAVILDTKSSPDDRLGNGPRVTVTAALDRDKLTADTDVETEQTIPRMVMTRSAEIEETTRLNDSNEHNDTGVVAVSVATVKAPDTADWGSVIAGLQRELQRSQHMSDSDSRDSALLGWLKTQPALWSEVTDAYAVHLLENAPLPSDFLLNREDGQTVVFVGARGVGRSTAMFKLCAARWQYTDRKPRLLILTEEVDHRHDRVLGWSQSGAVSCDAMSMAEAPRLRKLARHGDDDLFVEYASRGDGATTEKTARAIRKSLKPDVVALVINATAVSDIWHRQFEHYAPFGPTHLVVTHWDESKPWDRIARFAAAAGLHLSYRTLGTEPIAEYDHFTADQLRIELAGHAAQQTGKRQLCKS